MKTSWILSVYFLFIVGCAPTYIQPSFEDSNQYFLEKTINQLDVAKELEGRISPQYNIALLSIEDNLTLDKPIVAMIEDQIISSLIEASTKVLILIMLKILLQKKVLMINIFGLRLKYQYIL